MTPTYHDKPFRHWIADGWFEAPLPAIPPADSSVWEVCYDNGLEKGKRTLRDHHSIPGLAFVLDGLCHPGNIGGWSGLLGYPVQDDPTLHGGGLHVISPGGWLSTHLDYDLHPRFPGKRRALSLVVFMHGEWLPSWGGSLVLCGPDGGVVRRVYPAPGRLVAFECSDLSYHGVEPVTGPAERVSVSVNFLADSGPSNTRRRALFLPPR